MKSMEMKQKYWLAKYCFLPKNAPKSLFLQENGAKKGVFCGIIGDLWEYWSLKLVKKRWNINCNINPQISMKMLFDGAQRVVYAASTHPSSLRGHVA